MTTTNAKPEATPLPKLVRKIAGSYQTEDSRFSVQRNGRKDKYAGYTIFDTSKKDEYGFSKIIAHAVSTLPAAQRKIKAYLKRGWC